MTDLDDVSAVRAADPGGMLDAVGALASHCRDGYEAGLGASSLPSAEHVSALVVCGMGGSGVAGDVIRALYAPRLGVPVVVVKGPDLPEFCGPHALALASSYSGNTGETLACFEEALRRGCRVVAISSGGELAARARESGTGLVLVPGGLMPRAALGYLALGSLGALEAAGVVPPLAADLDEAAGELEILARRLGPGRPAADNAAKLLATSIGERVPVVWGAEGIGSVAAARWKTQFNENAKVPSWAASMPELSHNEVVGWTEGAGTGHFLVALRHEGESPDVAARFPVSIEIAGEAGLDVEEVWAAGRTALARLLTLVTMGDFASTYVAIARGFDPTPVEAIDRLKRSPAAG